MIDLLPCPFCGGEPTLNVIHECEDGAGEVEFAYVYCSHCGTQRGERPSEFTARQAWNLRAPAQAPMDREKVAKIFAYIWHGDLGEWQGFLSKADAFLTYPAPSTERECTCDPSERPEPCQKKYAFSECLRASVLAMTSTNLGSHATGTPSREPTGEYTITPAEHSGEAQ